MIKSFFFLAITLTLFLTGCGGSSSSETAASVSDLSQLPNASSMLSGNSVNGISTGRLFSLSSSVLGRLDLHSVTGTPPLLKDLAASNADTYFWGGVVAAINTAGSCSESNRNKFWGTDTSTPGPGGFGACQMASSTGEALGRMLSGTSTLCYMKSISGVASGVTVSGLSSQAELFKQQEGNRTVKIVVSGMPEDDRGRPGGAMNVFFTVYGTSAVGSDVYKYDMFMCSSGTVTSKETLTVTKSTGQVLVTSSDSRGGSERGSMSVEAFLKASGSSFVYDPAKNRTADVKYTGSWGTYKGNIVINALDQVKGKRWHTSDWGTHQTYSVAAFSGTGIDSFRFLQACLKGTSTGRDARDRHNFTSNTEYRTSNYAAIASSELDCSDVTLATDSFYAAGSNTVAALDTTGLDCNMTTDSSATMDFTNAAVLAIKETCDGETRKLANYSMCDGEAVRTAQALCMSGH